MLVFLKACLKCYTENRCRCIVAQLWLAQRRQPKKVASFPQHVKLWSSLTATAPQNLIDFLSCAVSLIRCDDKAFKKLMSNFGSSRSEETCSAVVELLERVTKLHKQLELKESQAEIDMDQVQTTTPGWATTLSSVGSIYIQLFSLDSVLPRFAS